MEYKNCDSIRLSHHSDDLKKRLVNRLHRIEGQVRGIEKMIKENVYCDDILNQISSVKSAMDGVSQILLEAHIKSCVLEQIKKGDSKVLDELLKTLKKMLR